MTETEWPDDWPLRAIERIERAEEEALNFSRMMVAEEKRAQKAEREVAELREALREAANHAANLGVPEAMLDRWDALISPPAQGGV